MIKGFDFNCNPFSAMGVHTPSKGVGGASLPTPVLTWLTASSDATPDFSFDAGVGVMVAGDAWRLEIATNSGFTAPTVVTGTVSAPDAIDGNIATTLVSPLPRGTNYARVQVTGKTNWSNTASQSVDFQMTSAATKTILESASDIFIMTLTANQAATFAIGGVDAAKAKIVSSNQLWSNGGLDYASPTDTGANNVYDITITPTSTVDSAVGPAQALAFSVLPNYTEQALVFDGTRGLYKSAVSATSVDNLLMTFSFKWTSANADKWMFVVQFAGYSLSHGMYWLGDGSQLKSFINNASGQSIINYLTLLDTSTDSLSVNDRITILMFAAKTGERRIGVFKNGTLLRNLTGTSSPDGTQISLNGRLGIGGNVWPDPPPSMNNICVADIYDARIFASLASIPDWSDVTQQRKFINADGTTVSPAIGNTALGTPIIQMPQSAAQANALTNLGSGGSFTSKQGTFP